MDGFRPTPDFPHPRHAAQDVSNPDAFTSTATNQSPSTVARKVGTGRAFALVSVVVPARNEAANLAVLLREIEAALAARAHEILVVADGSTDATAATLVELFTDGLVDIFENARTTRVDQAAACRGF
ncbi:glycosyltransferase [Aurantimonas marina]|uniref:glycosyltransferase n=1 Tax=Aurantimonas marina TaxID=2780508 RepID=UPI0019D02AE8|nr:glycosyltransferase [Aurantimonas marina]